MGAYQVDSARAARDRTSTTNRNGQACRRCEKSQQRRIGPFLGQSGAAKQASFHSQTTESIGEALLARRTSTVLVFTTIGSQLGRRLTWKQLKAAHLACKTGELRQSFLPCPRTGSLSG